MRPSLSCLSRLHFSVCALNPKVEDRWLRLLVLLFLRYAIAHFGLDAAVVNFRDGVRDENAQKKGQPWPKDPPAAAPASPKADGQKGEEEEGEWELVESDAEEEEAQ